MSGPQSSRVGYDGRLFDVVIEDWDGHEREIVEHPGSTAIVAVHHGAVVLVRQLREPARQALLELPAGTLEDGEEPLVSAQRELAEEVGLHGGRWRELGGFWTSPGFLREYMHVFVAEELDAGEADPDDDEEVEIVRWPVADIEGRIGELEDAKTIAGLLLYLRS
ncbi:MAG: NUDIX hydrolase [Thermoleophilia bacterium]